MLTTRETKKVTGNIHAVCSYYKHILTALKNGQPEQAITLINKVRPVDEISLMLGRSVTVREANDYLQSMNHITDVKLAKVIGTAKILQDARQAARKQLQFSNLDGAITRISDAIKQVATYYR